MLEMRDSATAVTALAAMFAAFTYLRRGRNEWVLKAKLELIRNVYVPLANALALRFAAAHGFGDARELLERMVQDSVSTETLLRITRRSLFRIYRKRLAPGFSLFFPSVGGWFLPFNLPYLALSVSPRTLVVLVHRETSDQSVRSVLARSRLLSGLSIGKSPVITRVIIPPTLLARGGATTRLERSIPRIRSRNVRLLDRAVDLTRMAFINSHPYMETIVGTDLQVALQGKGNLATDEELAVVRGELARVQATRSTKSAPSLT